IEGARSMGIDDNVGSLKAGKRADLIMVSTRDLNLGVFTDPAHMIVTATQPGNVDTVMIDGRILKRGGKLTALNVQQIVREAAAAKRSPPVTGRWPSALATWTPTTTAPWSFKNSAAPRRRCRDATAHWPLRPHMSTP